MYLLPHPLILFFPLTHYSLTTVPTPDTADIAFLEVNMKPMAFLYPHPESFY